MAQSLGRTFSFNDGDELSLSSSGQNRYNSHQETQPYRDVPFRDTQVSPPMQFSPPSREYNVSPPSPSYQGRSPLPPLPQRTDSTSSQPPLPPPHSPPRRPISYSQPEDTGTNGRRNLGSLVSNRTTSTTTPGMDNLGEAAAGGGIAGIAFGVANENERESGIEATRSMGNYERSRQGIPLERGYDTIGSDNPYIPDPPVTRRGLRQHDSYSSTTALGGAAASPGRLTPQMDPSDEHIPMTDYPSGVRSQDVFGDNPYTRFSTAWDARVGDINPNDIDDDVDDTIAPPIQKRRSMLSFGRHSDHGPEGAATAGVVANGAAAGGLFGSLGGLFTGKAHGGSRNMSSGDYGPVPGQGVNGLGNGGIEKSEWLSRQTSGNKRMRWIVGILIAFLVIGAIVGGVVGGIVGSKNNNNSTAGSGGSGESAAQDDGSGDLTKDSAEIKQLLNNTNLHKVFPGIDYTPFNAQYPACLSNMPSQNNVTRDMAVLSQLTNAVRLYGTDCNQTEMVLHAIDKLDLTDMKIWLGVWLSDNDTTTNRQLNAMYTILDANNVSSFAGVIVGNEVLFRKDMTETQLSDVLSGVKSNFTAKKIDLPVATSDLGDDWTSDLTTNVDFVMSNIHPFFAGVPVDQAAGWTIDFWNSHDTVLTQGTSKKNLISETGWPSGGGNDCGASNCTSDTEGSVAGVDEMNTFMNNFVCQALNNGTQYFWFEAFDEPWKVQFNTPGKEWEDKWGLMDPGRDLKPGLKIPDCGGKTVG